MLAAIFLIGAQVQTATSADYFYTRIPTPEGYDSTVEGALTEDGQAFVNWFIYVPPGHGVGALAVPFYWNGIDFTKVSLEGAEYGHVRLIQGDTAVGEVTIDSVMRPARWRRDPTHGWGKAKLSYLKDHAGRAVWISNDEVVLVNADIGALAWRGDQISILKADKFDPVFMDSKGRIFGNKYENITIGSARQDTSAGFFSYGEWHQLAGVSGRESKIEVANRHGFVIKVDDSKQSQLLLWTNGTIYSLPKGEERYLSAMGMNNADQVVGFRALEEGWAATLWERDKLTDLSQVIPGIKLERAIAINSSGQILAVAPGTTKQSDLFMNDVNEVYLLTPVKQKSRLLVKHVPASMPAYPDP